MSEQRRRGRAAWMAGVGLAVALAAGACSRGVELTTLPRVDGGGGGETVSAAADLAIAAYFFDLRKGGDFPDLDDEAEAFRLEASTGRARVAELAGGLGLDGDPIQLAGGAWSVVDGDRELRVDPVPGLPWYVGPVQPRCDETVVSGESIDPAPPADRAGPDAPVSSDGGRGSGVVSSDGRATPGCVGLTEPGSVGTGSATPGVEPAAPVPAGGGVSGSEGGVSGSTGSGAEPGTKPEPAPQPPPGSVEDCRPVPCGPDQACIQSCQVEEPYSPPPRPADLPRQAEAEDIARRAATDAGFNLRGAQVAVHDAFDTWDVTIDLAVGGRIVHGMTMSIGVGPKGSVTRASGFLAETESLGAYPLTDVDDAFSALKRQFEGGGPGPETPALGAPEPAVAPDPGGSGGDVAVDLPAGAPIPTEPGEPVVRTTTGVRLGLGFAPRYSGRPDAFLVPIYVFSFDDDRGDLTITAVTADHLGGTDGGSDSGTVTDGDGSGAGSSDPGPAVGADPAPAGG